MAAEAPTIPLLTPYKLGRFNLSHRYTIHLSKLLLLLFCFSMIWIVKMCDGFWFFFNLLGLKSCYGVFFFLIFFFFFCFNLPKKKKKKWRRRRKKRFLWQITYSWDNEFILGSINMDISTTWRNNNFQKLEQAGICILLIIKKKFYMLLNIYFSY